MATNYPPEEMPPEPSGGGLGRQVGPLPLWGWGAIGIGVVVILYLRGRSKAATQASGTVGATNGPTGASAGDTSTIADELAILMQQIATIHAVEGSTGPPGPPGPGTGLPPGPHPGAPPPAPSGGWHPRYVTVTKWYPGNQTGDLTDIARNAGMNVSSLLALPLNAKYRDHPGVVNPGDKVQVG